MEFFIIDFDERSLQLLFQIVGDNDELERMIFNMI